MPFHKGYKNILLTGEPKSGKSTLLKELLESVEKKSGIITNQILDKDGERTGFEIVDAQGNTYLLSSKTIVSDKKFANKYWIHTDGIKKIMDQFSVPLGDLIYLDEIGPMQITAEGFTTFAKRLLDCKNPLLGAIKLDDSAFEFIQDVKKREDTLIVNISDPDFDKQYLYDLIKKIKKSQNYLLEKERFIQKSENTRSMESQSATRTLHTQSIVSCDCSFYESYGICSHSIALRQINESMTDTIITYQENYKQELIDMILTVYEGELGFIGYERPDIYNISGHYLDQPGNHFRLVINEKKELLGCVGIQKKTNKLAYLRRMILKKEYRRKGIGVKMLGTVFTFAKKQGYETLLAGTVKENTTAIAFYKNQGFEQIDRAPKDITAAEQHICLKIDL